MKTITKYISEKLKIGKTNIKYTCQPQNRDELRAILEERLTQDKNANLNDIDVSQITYMGFDNNYKKGLFDGLDPHNIDISQWDVSNVENMRGIFFNCHNFIAEGLESWDVSSVKNMNAMFHRCHNFNCDLSYWDVSKVEDMSFMFDECKKFDCDLSDWDVSNVKDMNGMFEGCKNFDCDLSNWDMSNVENTSNMFISCNKFKGNGLKKWNMSNVKDMHRMFYGCKNFDGEGLEKWNIDDKAKNKHSMYEMFKKCPKLKNKPSWYIEG